MKQTNLPIIPLWAPYVEPYVEPCCWRQTDILSILSTLLAQHKAFGDEISEIVSAGGKGTDAVKEAAPCAPQLHQRALGVLQKMFFTKLNKLKYV